MYKLKLVNPHIKTKFAAFFTFVLLLSLLTPHSSLLTPVSAQLEIAESFDIASENVEDGDIVSFRENGAVLSDKDYDEQVFGVVNTNPLVVYRRVDGSGMPVVRNGTVDVNVTTLNGPIRKGDFITTSPVLGKGQKSTASGYAVGVALEDFGEESGEVITYTPEEGGAGQEIRSGKIIIAVKIEYTEIDTARSANRLLDAINAALFRNTKNPEQFVNILRFILAGLAIIISFIIAFVTLGRTIPKAMEALGRNPLARTTIQFGMILNIIFTIGIAVVGIIAAIIILRF